MSLDFGNGPGGPPPPPDDAPDAPLTCEVCGTPLHYAGRGRKPRFCDEHKSSSSKSSGSTGTSRPRGSVSDKELAQACENLAAVYDIACMPLAILSPNAANLWIQNASKLNQQNRQTLANNKELVRKINSAGQRGGSFAFILTHVIAVAPVVAVLASDARGAAARARAARAEEEAAYGGPYEGQHAAYDQGPEAGTPFDPDAAFRAG